MRPVGAAVAMLALVALPATAVAASETPDGGAAAIDGAGGGDAAPTESNAVPTVAAPPALPAAPALTLPPPSAGPPVDPEEAAAASARRAEAAWPLAYVDRPQTLLKNMEALSLSARGYRGPPGYSRFLGGAGYAKGVTDAIELGLAFPRLFCTGTGDGACTPSLRPDVSFLAAAVRSPTTRLAVGATLTDFVYSADLWARLKLVIPHLFSFEVEPDLFVGVQTSTRFAWWNPSVIQDGNQSRLSLAFDANVQLTPHVLLWADGIPYVPLDDLGAPRQTALQVAAGLNVSFTKSLALGVSCLSLDVLPTRDWEYVPDFRGCTLAFVARRFGARPVAFGVGPIPTDFY